MRAKEKVERSREAAYLLHNLKALQKADVTRASAAARTGSGLRSKEPAITGRNDKYREITIVRNYCMFTVNIDYMPIMVTITKQEELHI